MTTDYSILISSQYQMSSKFMAHLANHIQKIEDATSLINDLWEYFDIDLAIGKQLDALGVILGQSRIMSFQPTDGSSATLDDETYRLLLKVKVAWNHWDGKTQSLIPIWQEIFPGGTIIINDSLNMSAVITMYGSFSSIIVDLINNGLIVPRPEGVQYTYDFGAGPYFGFDFNNAYISGLDAGKFT